MCLTSNKTYLKRILGKQKQVAKLMSSDGISIPLWLLMKELNVLFKYIPNKHSTTSFMNKNSSKLKTA